MNSGLPDWNIEAELPVPSQRRPFGLDHDLVELLWQNGQVVLHSQTHKKPEFGSSESSLLNEHDQTITRASGSRNPTSLIADNETESWLDCPVDDSFEKELCSSFLTEFQPPIVIGNDKGVRQFVQNKLIKFHASDVTSDVPSSQHSCLDPNSLPSPRFPSLQSALQPGNFRDHMESAAFQSQANNLFQPSNGQFRAAKGSGKAVHENKEGSVMTVASSHCGSNQVANDADMSRVSTSVIINRGVPVAVGSDYVKKVSSQSDLVERETPETAIPSSSGGSGSSYGRTSNHSIPINSLKRKGRDAEESDSPSEAAELESAAANKSTQRSGTARRSRAAEVHNLSERRRRDRINEKMRTLQELIPHSNKSDKASMLDEAIEYMKSLQFQLQMMWMGSGMASMMFPSVQHYISRMGMAMGPPSLPAMHLTRMSMLDQAMSTSVHPPAIINPVNYNTQLNPPSFSDQYATYMGFHPLQTASQPMNMFSYGGQPNFTPGDQ